MRKSDSIERVPYRIGYSFKNPEIVKPLTFERKRPFFAMSWAGGGPADANSEFWKSGQVRRFPSVWRRAAKNNTSDKVGSVRAELPNFDELGEAPGPTSSSGAATTTRNVWGSLANDLLTMGGSALQETQQLQLVKAQVASQRVYRDRSMFPYINVRESDGSLGVLGWGLVITIVGIVGSFSYYSYAKIREK